MTRINAVIGAAFGDEGKGLMTDYLARQDKDAIVVRSNGGAQAGHTVTLPDGTRHVFSHFGSGTFTGAGNYLSEFFVTNPMLWLKEAKQLKNKFGYVPVLDVHPDSLITTPYDMLLNMAFEEHRDGERHGSCGVGFGETIERSETFLKISVKDLYNEQQLRDDLLFIREEYVPSRLWFDLPDKIKKVLYSDALVDNYLDTVYGFLSNINIDGYEKLTGKDIIFEGAQGLMLDQRHHYFPHVTRSNTGMKNVMAIVDQIGSIDPNDISVHYMTRAYTTRHGAGPLKNEMPDLPFDVVDDTNIHNDWQGSLRFAPLDFDVLYDTIQDDAQNYPAAVNQKLVFTCADQIRPRTLYVEDNEEHVLGRVDYIEKMISMGDYISYGPTHENVRRTSDE